MCDDTHEGELHMEFTVVSRPADEPRFGRRGLSEAIRETLTSGRAVSVLIAAGETYAVTRNRVAATGSQVARGLNSSVRTTPSADRTAVLVWLVPKPNGNGHI